MESVAGVVWKQDDIVAPTGKTLHRYVIGCVLITDREIPDTATCNSREFIFHTTNLSHPLSGVVIPWWTKHDVGRPTGDLNNVIESAEDFVHEIRECSSVR